MSLCNSYCCPLSNIYSCNDDYLCKPGKQYCLDMEYSVTSVVTSKKVNGLCGYDYGESPGLNVPQYIDQSRGSTNCHTCL